MTPGFLSMHYASAKVLFCFSASGLSACTAEHHAEEVADRRPFIRWVRYNDGVIRRVREYGCSDGFDMLIPYAQTLSVRGAIGWCHAVAYPINGLVEALAGVIRAAGYHPMRSGGVVPLSRCDEERSHRRERTVGLW